MRSPTVPAYLEPGYHVYAPARRPQVRDGRNRDVYRVNSFYVDGPLVLCTPGGSKGTVAALDKMTGTVRWQSKEFTDLAHYSSIVPARINGTPQYVQRTEKSVVGIAANDGKLMWQTSFPGRTAVIPTPIVKGNAVYVTAGYGSDSKMVRIGAKRDTAVANHSHSSSTDIIRQVEAAAEGGEVTTVTTASLSRSFIWHP